MTALCLDPDDKCLCRVELARNLRRVQAQNIRPHTVSGRCSVCGGQSDEKGWT
jgi:hypothetical protein